MADKPDATRNTSHERLTKDGAVPRMGMNIAVPAGTQPPAAAAPPAAKN